MYRLYIASGRIFPGTLVRVPKVLRRTRRHVGNDGTTCAALNLVQLYPAYIYAVVIALRGNMPYLPGACCYRIYASSSTLLVVP